MDTIIINTQNSSNAKFIMSLVQKIGEKGKILSKTEQEDFLLGELMHESKTGKKVSKELIMKTLKRK